MKKETILLSGLHCANCAQTIDKKLAKTNGILHANVNFSSSKTFIEYDENKIQNEEIIKIISDLGYKGILPKKDSNTEKELYEKDFLIYSVGLRGDDVNEMEIKHGLGDLKKLIDYKLNMVF